MNQDDIYNLLLIILLVSNQYGNLSDDSISTQSSLNDLILTSLLLNSCSNNNNSNNCNNCNRNNNNTTF